MARSDVFERLVKNDRDIVGLTAYGIYKKCRNDFISQKQAELGLIILPEEIMEEFYASQTDSILELYREHADSIVGEFAESERKKVAPSFWYGVMQSYAASFM